MSLPASITFSEAIPGYPVFIVEHPTCRARVALNGAHVMEWTPVGQKPVLYLSPQAVLENGKPIRGGVPLCWPWFNTHSSDGTKPMHGFARAQPWKLMHATDSEAGVKMHFALCNDADTCALWPHDFEAHVTLELGTQLAISLKTVNKSGHDILLTEALHTYLAVGDISQTTVRGLAGTDYLDTVGERTMRHQEGDITFDREVDRQYASTATVSIEDTAWDRTLVVEKEGSATTVVWNPWIEKSKRLGDLPDDAFHGFLCVEAANAGTAAVTVAQGAAHEIRTVIRVQ